MLILGISSATNFLETALVENSKTISEYSSEGKLCSENLIKYIEKILKESKKDVNDLTAIAVTVGPGSYGGLRGGLAIAKGFAQTLNIPVFGVSTLEAIAHNIEDFNGTIFIASHARKDEYNIAIFNCLGNKLRRIENDFVASIDILIKKIQAISGKISLVSEKQEILEILKKEKFDGRIKFVNGLNAFPRASVVAKLSINLQPTDPLTLNPKYSHSPNIKEYKAK